MSVVASSLESRLERELADRFGDRYTDKGQALKELAISLLESSPSHLDAYTRQESTYLFDALEPFAEDMLLATAHIDAESRWAVPLLRTIDEYPKKVEKGAYLSFLSDCANLYMRTDWANSPALERWIVRQMIFAESYAFSREFGVPFGELDRPAIWSSAKSLGYLLIGATVAFSLGQSYGLAVGVLTICLWITQARHLTNMDLARTFELLKTFVAMKRAYVVAIRVPPCPVEVKAAIAHAEVAGAIWPQGLRALLERALTRDRARW